MTMVIGAVGMGNRPRLQDIVIVGANGQPRGVVITGKPPAPQTVPVKYWTCKNCGHMAEQSAQLKELSFKWLGPLTSKTSCPNCGSYTLQQAYDETFKAGYFVVVKAYNGIRGKG